MMKMFFFLGFLHYRGALPLGDGNQGGGKFAAMGGAPLENKVSGQYIVGYTEAIRSNSLDPGDLGSL
jgi:hypothetical protein